MLLLLLLSCSVVVSGEDYSVSSIWCSYSPSTSSYSLTAELTKPLGYTGHPVLADTEQQTEDCSITHLAGLQYKLQISDLASCGVLVRNGFLSVRVWFPQIPGVFTSEDQEVIILCKPPEVNSEVNEVIDVAESLAEGEVVTEESERLVYQVSLYRETEDTEESVTAGVPIGTLLQLRVSVQPTSPVWRYLSLHQLSLSPSITDPSPDHITHQD